MKKTGWFLLAVCLFVFCCGAAFGEELPTLVYNSQGDAVLALQQRLTELGYYSFRITGVYQENSQRAVREFQAEHGYAQTGNADAALQLLIHSQEARPKATPTPAPTPAPTPTMPPLSMTQPYPGIIQYGNTGDNVRRIQTKLTQLGYYSQEISGNFLGNTRNAVRDFQRQNGISADGVVGEKTWQALFFDPAPVDASATARPTPAPTPVPYHIMINVTTQVTSVYGLDENGEYTQLVKHMLCSTGTESDPTPLKTYVLNGATARWCHFPKWGTYAQYWTRMDASNAFHSVIYAESGNTMSLKTGSYTGLGKRASHGCVRLMLEDAKWIYDNCGKGTEVVVYMGEADEELTKSLKIPPLDYSVMLPQPTPGPTQSPAYSTEELPPMPFKTLQRGTESEAVYWLQSKLAELGYYKGTITGGYYAGTVAAVKAFQKDNGLTADGVAGKQTLNKLYQDVLATPAPTLEPTPTPIPTPEPTLVLTATPTPNPTATQTPYSARTLEPRGTHAPWETLVTPKP